jgi:hypothetical protein
MSTVTRDGDYLVETYDNGAVVRLYFPEGTVIYVPPRTVTELEIKRALTAAERAGIRAAVASDTEVADWMDYVQAAMRSGQPLPIDDADLRAGFLRLRTLGVFTVARLQELQAQLLA